MKVKIINTNEFKVSKWSGGETMQLAIYPEDAVFSEKDFLFRISSATFSSTESTFSDFRNYQRYILPLVGELSLQHERIYSRDLKPYEVEYFDGAWTTHSQNSLDCRDYNFIYRKGAQAKLSLLKNEDSLELEPDNICTLFSQRKAEVLLDDKVYLLEDFSLLFLDTEEQSVKLKVEKADETVILSEFKTI